MLVAPHGPLSWNTLWWATLSFTNLRWVWAHPQLICFLKNFKFQIFRDVYKIFYNRKPKATKVVPLSIGTILVMQWILNKYLSFDILLHKLYISNKIIRMWEFFTSPASNAFKQKYSWDGLDRKFTCQVVVLKIKMCKVLQVPNAWRNNPCPSDATSVSKY